MSRKETFTPADARPDLPYSHAVRANGFIYVSGQVGVDPATKSVVEGGIAPQARQTLENLKRALTLAGASLEDVIKVNVYLTDMSEFSQFNAVYLEYFTSARPARTTVGTSGLATAAMRIEIEAIALAS